MASTLVEEIVEEILIRIPPDEPAHLVCAALVCKSWRRIVSNHGFRHRYRKFHRSPPLLGYIESNVLGRPRFFPTTSTASRISMAALRTLNESHNWWAALDCRHDRVLIYIIYDNLTEPKQERLIIWNPITGGQQHLSVPPLLLDSPMPSLSCAGSVLCATDACDHFDCGGGPFIVVFVWTCIDGNVTWASIYSSETGAWSDHTSINIFCYMHMSPGLFIRDALYFKFTCFSVGFRILKYDLYKHGLSVIDTPRLTRTSPLVMKGENRGLQLVTLSGNYIYTWSQQDVTNGNHDWMRHKVMDLQKLLREGGSYARKLIGFLDGTNIILVSTSGGIFGVNLKSKQVRKVHERKTDHGYTILPYMSFYNPR